MLVLRFVLEVEEVWLSIVVFSRSSMEVGIVRITYREVILVSVIFRKRGRFKGLNGRYF